MTYFLSNFQIYNMTLLSTVTVLYVTSPGLTDHIAGRWYILTTFTNFSFLPLALGTTDLFSLSMNLGGL